VWRDGGELHSVSTSTAPSDAFVLKAKHSAVVARNEGKPPAAVRWAVLAAVARLCALDARRHAAAHTVSGFQLSVSDIFIMLLQHSK
jgi:hypothetical protein